MPHTIMFATNQLLLPAYKYSGTFPAMLWLSIPGLMEETGRKTGENKVKSPYSIPIDIPIDIL